MPSTEQEWENIALKTAQRWQYPNCIGSCDGKHIGIMHPKNSGSDFFNYKSFFSIVLLALVDYDYNFIYVDVGCQGRISDGGVYRNSSLCQAMSDGSLNLPQPRPLPTFYQTDDCVQDELPFVFVGDDAFPLNANIMKPYAQRNLDDRKRIFNYRSSRIRRVTENAFGILVHRFRIFTSKILLSPEKVTTITLAAIVLHNMLRQKSRECYTPDGFLDSEDENGNSIDGSWRKDNCVDFIRSLGKSKSNHSSKKAEAIRDAFADHFMGEGQIPWQWKILI